MPEQPSLAPELRVVKNEPEDGTQDTAETSETLSVQDYLTRATALRDKLQFWQAQGERGLSTLVRQADIESQHSVEDEDVETRAQELQATLDYAVSTLNGLETGLLRSDILQQRFQDTFGRKILSLDDAKNLAAELLQPLYERYAQHKKDHAGSGARTRDGISSVDAAWDVTAMAVPSGVDITNEAHLKDVQSQRETFKSLVNKLSLLPGPHHAFAKKFAEGHGDADTAYQLLHSYTFGKKKSKRFQKLDMDAVWGQRDLEKLEDMLEQVLALVQDATEHFPNIDIVPSRDARETYQEMKELFGERGFLGIEANETAFTLANGQKLIDMSPEQRREAERLLQEKLQEPDMVAFMTKVRSGEINKEEWMLMLQVPTMSVPLGSDGVHADAVGDALDRALRTGRGTQRGDRRSVPITMQTMEQYLTPDMRAREQGELLHDTTWYREEAFYILQQLGNTDTTPETIRSSGGVGTLSWRLVTREVLPSSWGKNHTEQDAILGQQMTAYGIDPQLARRRTPVEIVHHFFLRLRATQERTMANPWRYDWSQVRVVPPVGISWAWGVALRVVCMCLSLIRRIGRGTSVCRSPVSFGYV